MFILSCHQNGKSETETVTGKQQFTSCSTLLGMRLHIQEVVSARPAILFTFTAVDSAVQV